MNSLVLVLLDTHFLVCFLAVDQFQASNDDFVCSSVRNGLRPLLSALPAWFRLAQCLRRYYDTRKAFPHLANAGKYSTTLLVVLFSSLAAASEGWWIKIG